MFTIKKQIALFLSIMLCSISITSILFAGHIETQQVLTPNGFVSIKDLNVGDLVISYNFNAEKPEDLFINTPIIKTQKNYADALYEIYIEDNRCISASPQQKFLVATQEDKDQERLTFRIEVIEAQYLTDSHMLLDSNLLTVLVTQTHKKELYKEIRKVKKYFWKSIKHVKRKTTLTRIDLYSIELEEAHNYLIPVFSQGIDCKDDKNIPLILMHNGLPVLAAGISLAFGSSLSSISFAGASVAAGGVSLLAGPAGLAIGAAALGSYALYTLFDKGHKEQLFLEMSTNENSNDSSKNQEDSEKNKDPKGNKNLPPPPPLGKKDRDRDSKERARNNFNISSQQSKSKSTHPDLAHNVNAQVNLNKKMHALQNAQKKAVRTEVLDDGRIRYYFPERASNTDGPTRGASYVLEHNPTTGQVRSWNECYDRQGNVNRVHPKTIDGQDLNGQHYPPTKSESIGSPKP